tara:strand:- start:830 stop:1525 length:696 start_codon:yes stop_codon:yes gene_type:complete
MKRIVILVVLVFGFYLNCDAQFGGRTDGKGARAMTLIPEGGLRLKTVDKSAAKESVDLIKKKYLTYSYELASVDAYDTKAYVRYNIFEDEMEFVKDESIYYLAKEVGRKVHFKDSDFTYKVYELNYELKFFKVLVDGKNSLVAKQGIRYIDAKVAISGYDRPKPANYKRVKDEIYIALEDNSLVKISKNKNQFFSAFGDKESDMKSYMKKNRLNHKNLKDLKEAVTYFNTL